MKQEEFLLTQICLSAETYSILVSAEMEKQNYIADPPLMQNHLISIFPHMKFSEMICTRYDQMS